MSLSSVAALVAPALPLLAAAAVAARPRLAYAVVPAAALAALASAIAVAGTGTERLAHDGMTLWGDTSWAIGVGPDRIGSTIALLTLTIGLVVLAAGARSFEGDSRAARFAALGAALVGCVAVTATATTLLTLALGWFGSGLALLGLLRLGHGPAADDGVKRTARTFAAGDAALAAALVLAATSGGSVDLRAPADAALPGAVAVLLVLAGITRSALLPAHRWLPATVAAPTPVSALLHAGVVNGVGVLVLRTAPITADSRAAMVLLGAAGAATAVVATAVMLARTDAKGALAWSTAGQMGFMAVQLAVGALASALFHLVGHAMYKAALFLGVGATVRSVAEHRHLPTPTDPMARAPRLLVGAAVPAVAIAAALALFAPELSAATAMLVVGFGWLTGRNLVDGWLRNTDRRFAGFGIVAGFVAPMVYVGAMSAFKSFVGPALPEAPAGAVPAGALAVALVVIAAGGAGFAVLRAGARARVTSALVALGAPPVPRAARIGGRTSGLSPAHLPVATPFHA